MKKIVAITCISLIAFGAYAQKKMDLEAHRGGRGLMPENSIEAMISALDMGVTTLEMDLGISKDGQVVVSHDSYMASDFMRKPDGSDISKNEEKTLLLYGMNYEEIKKYDGGTKPHSQFPEQKKLKTYKPLFSELIDSVENYIKKNKLKPVMYNVEIKSTPAGDGTEHPEPEVFVQKVMDIIQQHKIGKRTIIQSFDIRPLHVLHQSYPKQRLSYLIYTKDSFSDHVKKLGFKPAILSPLYTTVTSDLVKEAHQNKVEIIPWTVNTVADIQKMEDLEVDGIISDYPNLLLEVFGTKKK